VNPKKFWKILLFVNCSLLLLCGSVLGSVVDLITNGDFEGGFYDDGTGDMVPNGWVKDEGRPEEGATLTEVEGKDGGSAVRWTRLNGGSTGDHLHIVQDVNVDVDNYRSIILIIDVYVIYHNLEAGGWATPAFEWPVYVYIPYTATDGSQQHWKFGWYLDPPGDGSRTQDPGTGLVRIYRDKKVPAETWVSEMLLLKTALPKVKTIDKIVVGGAGWDYVGQADNVRLLGVPKGSAPSVELSVSSKGKMSATWGQIKSK